MKPPDTLRRLGIEPIAKADPRRGVRAVMVMVAHERHGQELRDLAASEFELVNRIGRRVGRLPGAHREEDGFAVRTERGKPRRDLQGVQRFVDDAGRRIPGGIQNDDLVTVADDRHLARARGNIVPVRVARPADLEQWARRTVDEIPYGKVDMLNGRARNHDTARVGQNHCDGDT